MPLKPSYREVTAAVWAALGCRAAVLVCDLVSLKDHPLDPLHRVFMPTTEEGWHLDPDTHGQEKLPFLNRKEADELKRNVSIGNEACEGRLARPDKKGAS